MNEQLRKAIEEATRVYPCGYNVDLHDHKASQAKFLRVIERSHQLYLNAITRLEQLSADKTYSVDDVLARYEAELIAALEGER